MTNWSKIPRQKRQRSPILWLMVLLVWSILLGWGLALGLKAAEPPEQVDTPSLVAVGTVDVVPERFQEGLKVYLDNCSSCHVPLPPEVMPSETWRALLLEPQEHYGRQLEPIVRPFIIIVWDYLRAFSRPLTKDVPIPFRLSESGYFKALHPRVTLPSPLSVSGCVSCHPGAAEYDYRRLTPEWQDSP